MTARTNALLRLIQGMAVSPETNATSDAVLMNRFVADRDGRAFSALMHRHGAMVLDVCRRILGNGDDAEDSLQATFLVLARKAHSIRSTEALASWLHGVARRVSLKARMLRGGGLRVEMAAQQLPLPRPDPMEELSCREMLSIFEEELERLPKKQRLPILLCCLEGLTLEEAAGRLGWKPGAVKGRLQRGRQRLHERLVRRGLTLSAVLAAVETSRSPASSAAVARLATAASHDSLARATGHAVSVEGISKGATNLARALLKTMALTRLTFGAGFLLATCLVAVGIAVRGTRQLHRPEHSQSTSARVSAATALIGDERAEAADDADVPIEVQGRVLDPTGKPFAGANLYVGYAVFGGGFNLASPRTDSRLRGRSGADGGFQFTFTRSELDAGMLDDSRLAVIAVADGHGPEWSPIAGQTGSLTLKLVEDFPVSGRILDSKGKPVSGARIRVLNIDSDFEENVTRELGGPATKDEHHKRWRGAFPERPTEVTTDNDGRFRLTGLGRDRIATLVQEEPISPRGTFYAIARPTNVGNAPYHGAPFDVVAPDTRRLRGVCRDRATGKPIAGVRMSVWNSTSRARFTDVNGRFEIPVASDILTKTTAVMCIVAEPEGDQPYFKASALAPRIAGSEPITMDFDLLRGIPLAGTVQSLPGKKPLRAGRVEYHPLFTNLHFL
jgi:RNA polymerase sigma factor (sigma-70 family)